MKSAKRALDDPFFAAECLLELLDGDKQDDSQHHKRIAGAVAVTVFMHSVRSALTKR